MPLLTTGAVDVAATTTTGVMEIGGQTLQCYHAGAGAGALFTPADDAAGHTGGISLPVPATDNIGCQLCPTALSNVNLPGCFTVGTDPAFFVRMTAVAPDPTRADAIANSAFLAVGFRTAGVPAIIAETSSWALMYGDADATPWADVALLGLQYTATAQVYSCFKTNSAAGATTDTTQVEADAVAFTYEVRVSAAGVVTCYRNGVLTTAGSSPGTLTAATVVSPMVIYVAGATPDAAPIITSLTYGLQ
jgi:hypothetical protein